MDKIKTTGAISQTIYSDTGNVMYIVNVELNENIVKVQSMNYSSKTKSLPDGKKVLVDYIVSSKGVESVEIINEDIILCKDDLGGELRVLVGFGIIVLLVVIILIIKKFV